MGITNKSKLVSNMVGYDVNSSGVWYRIIAPKNGKTYWISNSLLS
ncbi:hypothetical protein NBRC111893_884 [Lentilactobacillus kosonis]|uniref:Uncharacterized protein n=1 Tax=Lentilactobacillus kosonis TaxID=2810561 RepID=A0A401FKE1_9LACO|nr:hypothetical protein NBRC111893_884 [Lentilactobacillus kosonis]